MEKDTMKKFDNDQLQLGNFIAHGSFGAVYQGDYDGQKVAVKSLNFEEDDKEEKYFRQEASLWSKLDHPNVAKFIGATQLTLPENPYEKDQEGRNSEKLYWCMVSEFLEGGTVAELVDRNRKKKLPLKTVVQLGLDVARGLEYLHSQKIVHRDVKTQNMVLDGQGRAKLIDFGLSRKEASNPSEMTGGAGTKLYMAPEVRKCEPYDHKCDVYSFGLCLWEMFYRRPPEKTSRVSEKPCMVLGDCPDKLAGLMLRCWLKKEARPEMAEVVEALEEILEEAMEEEAKRRSKFKGCFSFFRRS